MSADNAIVVMKFQDGYKVRHMQATENLFWNDEAKEIGQTLNLKIVYEMFKHIPIILTFEMADIYATDLLEEYSYVEYGIITYESPVSWHMIERYYGNKE